MCFSHLNIVVPDDNKTDSVPWWLAIVISIPLTIITIAIIKIALVVRERNERAREQRRIEKKKQKEAADNY
jgi:membrane protein implicated in regulation of membrane protease activity